MFPTTQWTLILQAALTQSEDGLTALDKLCRRYWEPLRGYARLRGFTAADAEDITQSFFARLLENKTHAKAQRERGRFRTFLLHAMQNFIANHHRDTSRQKRGGGAEHEDITEHTDRVSTEQTPETLFEKQWAQAVINAAIQQLEEEHRVKHHLDRFNVMRPLLAVRHDGDTEAMAAQLGVSTANFRKQLHIFRHRFGDLVREEVGRLVSDPSEIDDELMHLMRVLGS